MRKPILLLLLFPLLGTAQPAVDWNTITEGKVSSYRKWNVHSLRLKKDDAIIKEIRFAAESNRLAVMNAADTLYNLHYDSQDRLVKITQEHRIFYIDYFNDDTAIKSMHVHAAGMQADTIVKVSFPYKSRPDITQHERYVIAKPGNDTVEQQYLSSVLNFNDDAWSYELNRARGAEWKKYNNGVSASWQRFNDHTEYDSVVTMKEMYHYKFYPDSVLVTISKDSVYDKTIVKGRLVQERLSFNNKILHDIFYNADSGVLHRIVYTYYPANTGYNVVWLKTFFNAAGRKVKKEYPAKKQFKLRNGTLVQRTPVVLRNCGGVSIIKRTADYGVWMFSSSIFFAAQNNLNARPDWLSNALHYNRLNSFDNELYYYKWKVSAPFYDSARLRYTIIMLTQGKEFMFQPLEDRFAQENTNDANKSTYRLELLTQDNKLFEWPLHERPETFPFVCDIVFFRFYKEIL